MKIAVIGSGISGLTCAYLLSRRHEVHLFEAADYIGGHTHTVDVEVGSGGYAVDTGFIVFNDWTYPKFIELMTRLRVPLQPTTMSFSVKTETKDFEYNGTDLNGLFAKRSHLFNPRFLRMVREILRFNREAPAVLEQPSSETSLGAYLRSNGYSAEFRDHYIVPMGAAIWSASRRQMEEFPIQYFVLFFKNHGMLSVDHRPQWRVIQGGSRSYIPAITAGWRERLHLRSPIHAVRRGESGVTLKTGGDSPAEARFDEAIFACHSDQTLKILGESATPEERRVLSAFAYQPNTTVLHTDIRVLPKRKRAWAAWNYFVPAREQESVAVSYNMNFLQSIRAPETFCVSLNMGRQIDPSKVLRKFVYHHPIYTHAAVHAQKEWSRISGVDRLHFCGAYWGFGFHEDGVKSGLRVAERLGERLEPAK
jgi:predicted NAD/FAD-binding protein